MGERLAVVSVSGGKDSTACALLAIERMGRENVRLVFADTGNEHEMTYRYVREYMPEALGLPVEEVRADFTADIERKWHYVAEKWPGKGVPPEIVASALAVLKPTGNPFLDLCIMKGRFPSRMAQFCTQELKRYPLDAHLMALVAEGYTVESWRGVRRDESRNRANSVERERVAEGYEIVLPIVDWTAGQTVAYVTERGVKLNPLYSLGMARVGCMPCINTSKNEISEIARRFPEHIDRIREWEQIVGQASKRGRSSFFTDKAKPDETIAEVFDRLQVDARVRWAMTTRGGEQYDLLKTGEAPACASLYGLCE